MSHRVEITTRAERDLALLFAAIHAADSEIALRWYRGLKKAILSLENSPRRCPVAREGKRFRHLLYGNRKHIYRVIFLVDERRKLVEILHIRHGARDDFEPGDLK